MNIPVLLQAKADILAHPDQCVMSSYFSTTLEVPGYPNAGGCGTAGCIAGWLMHRKYAGQTLAESRELNYREVGRDPDEIAAEYAGLQYLDAHRLFHLCDWPRALGDRFWHATTPEGRAEIMAERIDRFIETGGTV